MTSWVMPSLEIWYGSHTDLAHCEALLDEIDKMDQAQLTGDNNNHLVHHPLRETRSALEKLIYRMDNLETTFDKMAEKTSALIQSRHGLLVDNNYFSLFGLSNVVT